MRSSLLVLNGPVPGTALRLCPKASPFTVGRDDSRDLVLDDQRISRLHARIVYQDQQWKLEDCGSTNGMTVNSHRTQQATLEPGDLICIGDRMLLFVSDSVDSENCQPAKPGQKTAPGSLPADDQQQMRIARGIRESMSRVVRDSTVLCRLATQLYGATERKELLSFAMDALVDGIAAKSVFFWLLDNRGQLRCLVRRPTQHPSGEVPAGVAKTVKENTPVLGDGSVVEVHHGLSEKTLRRIPNALGNTLCVPLPAQESCRGAIECHRSADDGLFSRTDLDFAVIVAHQAGAAMENMEHRQRLESHNQQLRQRLSSQTRLVGSSEAMQDVHEQMARVGATDSTVLILGESGTGKELVAQTIHEVSRRSDGPYIAVNCAAISESLLESELFGHEAGAFTGAERKHIGQFERADQGTIFLDEVGELSAACQAKLLRVLEGHAFQRVGGQQSIDVDLRVIAATHRDLEQQVREGRFRQDLYYRLRVIDIRVPPLRDRGEDILELAEVFLEHFYQQIGRAPKRFSHDAACALQDYNWPGNVRELKNAVERAVVLAKSEEITTRDLGLERPEPFEQTNGRLLSLREVQRRHIEHVIRKTRGNKTQACRILGIGRGTLYAKLQE